MIVCPNKNLPEWKEAVDAVGEFEAYRMFIGNNHEVPTTFDPSAYAQLSSSMDEATLEDVETKVSHLQGVFAKHGVEVEVAFDGDIQEAANVTGIGTRKAKIKLNPNRVFQDSVPHEFGHIYVDLLGYDNPIVQQGIAQLRDKPIWNEISELYKDEALTAEEFEKEVLVTAIGRDYVMEESWEDSKWRMWVNKFLQAVADLLGIPRTVSRRLATDLINGDLRKDFMGTLSSKTQKQVAPIDKELSAKEKIVEVLQKKVNIYKKSANDVARKKLQVALDQAKKGKGEVAILRFLKFAQKQTSDNLERFEKFKANTLNPTKDNANQRLDLKRLIRMADYMESFKIIEDVMSALQGKQVDDIDFGKVTVDSKFLDDTVGPITRRIETMRREYQSLANDFIADFMLNYNTDRTLTKNDLVRMLTNVTEDISFTQRIGDAMAESPDQVLAIFDRIVSNIKIQNQEKATEFKLTQLKDKTLALEEFNRNNNISNDNFEEMYNFMLDRDSTGKMNGLYKNPKLPATDPRQQFYEMYDKNYKEYQKRLPKHYRRGNQIIGRVKEGTELIWETKGLSGIGDMAKQAFKDKVGRNANDTDFVEVFTDEANHIHKFIPIHFTGKVGPGNNQIKPEHLSLDMASSLDMFNRMSMNYSELNKVLPELEAIKRAVTTRTLEVRQGSKSLLDKDTQKPLVKSGADTNAAAMLVDYFDKNIFGEHKLDEGELLGMDRAKVLDALGNATSVVQLGLNIYSGVNNIIMGHVANFVEGAGGQFFDKRNWASAEKEYDTHLPSIVKDSMSRFKESKLEVWAETFDIFQEFDEYGHPIPPANVMKRFGTGAMFFINSSGEHMIQSKLAIAMAKHHKVIEGKIYSYNDYVLENNKKFDKESQQEFDKLPSVWDSFDAKDGKLDSSINKEDMRRFAERIKGVSQRLHGNYAKKDQAAINKYALGRLIMRMRKWLKPGWNRRFAKDSFDGRDNFDQRLGDNIGGQYTIAAYFVANYLKDLKGFKFELMSQDWDNLPEWKKQAIKRTVAEIAAVGATALIITLLAAEDDDEDRWWITDMAEYQARRLKSELTFYVNPFEAIKVLRSPAASLALVEKAAKFVGQLSPATGFERYETGEDKGKLKLVEYGKDLVPIYGQIDRLFEIEAQLGWQKR